MAKSRQARVTLLALRSLDSPLPVPLPFGLRMATQPVSADPGVGADELNLRPRWCGLAPQPRYPAITWICGVVSFCAT